ncbi:5' nucleotidase, NT5C type [Streptomyces marispadix]|uniref:5'-nucleotidase n=1 Tax=Streptomyces marispadix TaxID=2922868 RepID=A0ABS9T0H2_9ACTN|nr:hypothetical protein [Streptomyces marispadix]MCH6162032.1 hypothetical protein [Streptomyces marispadix]
MLVFVAMGRRDLAVTPDINREHQGQLTNPPRVDTQVYLSRKFVILHNQAPVEMVFKSQSFRELEANMVADQRFILGVDLDGVVADFYGYMREVTAEWKGVPIEELTEEVSFGLPEWGLVKDEYGRLHRFAVTQRKLFGAMRPIEGAPQALRRLSAEGVRIRIITHRLFISYFHQTAVSQTVEWLEDHAVQYWDLCFMEDKTAVEAQLYIEDSEKNVERIRSKGDQVIIFTNSTNRNLPDHPGGRADDWSEAERMIRDRYYEWRRDKGLALPAGPGLAALEK